MGKFLLWAGCRGMLVSGMSSASQRRLMHLVGAQREGERVEAGVSHGLIQSQRQLHAQRGSSALWTNPRVRLPHGAVARNAVLLFSID